MQPLPERCEAVRADTHRRNAWRSADVAVCDMTVPLRSTGTDQRSIEAAAIGRQKRRFRRFPPSPPMATLGKDLRDVPMRAAVSARRFVVILCGMAIFLTLIYCALFFPFPRSSDEANFFLAGLDMTRGNWRLHGWQLSPDNFATIDIPIYAALTSPVRTCADPDVRAPGPVLGGCRGPDDPPGHDRRTGGRQHRRSDRGGVVGAVPAAGQQRPDADGRAGAGACFHDCRHPRLR